MHLYLSWFKDPFDVYLYSYIALVYEDYKKKIESNKAHIYTYYLWKSFGFAIPLLCWASLYPDSVIKTKQILIKGISDEKRGVTIHINLIIFIY